MPFQWMFSLLFLVGFRSAVTSLLARNIEEENGPLVVSEAVQGTVGRLPCNVMPPVPEDKVALVIWYKEGHSKPIYSVDTRNSNFAKGTHWVEENFGGRASFQGGETPDMPAALTIKSTKNADSGIYRCRVDFQKSPTRNSKVQLKVIIPPEKLVILDDTGNHIPHYILGPYNEGTSINITCVSTGGRPLPNVTWWYENTLLDGTSTALSERRVSNVLHLKKLERKHLNRVLTCQASNNNLTAPITSAVTLDLNLRPLIVKLQGDKRPLSADSSYKLNCIVIGSRPAPTITWWKGSTPMRNTRDETTADGNITTSTLTFTPTIDDRGKFLSCRAEQTLIPESGMEDGWKLDIYHIPVVSLEFGTNLNTTTIREGADVFFECNIKSNPWVYRVSWRHNGNILDNNLAEGIVVANQSLVLQNVSRARSGMYTCVGSNREGDGESNPVQLDIRFAPVCRPGQKTVYSSGRQETAKVACEVEANPMDVIFVWKFNASAVESIDIPASLIAADRARSVAHYTPMTEHDYGTLLCWSSNEIGVQMDPCVYSIIPAGEPDPLANCTVLNQTSNSFQIECIEGFDGGLEQDFVMEVYVNGTTRNPRIYKSKSAYFEVRGLIPGMGYNVFLVAQNRKGRSNSTVLQVYTLKDPEKQTDLSLAYAPVIEDIRPFLGILMGIVGSIFLVALIIVIVVRMRGSTGRDRNNYSHQVSRDTLHNGQSMQDIRIGRETLQTSSADSIDKNPDIIPQDIRITDDHDEDDEWTTNNRNRQYATAALAEQNAVITSSTYDRIPYGSSGGGGGSIGIGIGTIDKTAQNQSHFHQQQLPPSQHQQQHHHTPQYITTYNTLIPVSKMGYTTQQNKTDLTYAELTVATQPVPGQQRIPYSSATLGRPRQSEAKRMEPTIYAQIDLAHHPMYSTSSMYGTNANTGVTMSHLSQLAAFPPPPPIFAHNPAINSTKITATSTVAGLGAASPGQGSTPVTLSLPATSVVGIGGLAGPGMIPTSFASCAIAGSGTGGGCGGGTVIAGYGTSSIPNSTPGILKTVPEEVHPNSISDDVTLPKDRNVNHATRF